METTPSGWNVINSSAGILSRTYSFAKNAYANTAVMRLPDGTLLVISPSVKTDAAAFDELSAYGDVAAIVAPNGFHYLGVPEWRTRFPEARFFAPDQAVTRMEKKSKVDLGNFESLDALAPLLGDKVGLTEAPSTRCGEIWAWSETDEGCAWFTSDVLANMKALPPKFPMKQLFAWTGSAPGYRVFGLAAMAILKNKKESLRALLSDVRDHPPTFVIPGHGELVESELAATTESIIAAAL